MAACYTFQPTFPTSAPVAGYNNNSQINVESLLRNKVDIYSALNNERSPINNTYAAPMARPAMIDAAPVAPIAPFAQIPTQQYPEVAPVETARAYGAETAAKLVQIIAARLAAIAQPELAMHMAAHFGAEICAQIAVELTLAPIAPEMAARRCVIRAAEQGAQLGAMIAKRLACGPAHMEQAARIGEQLFADTCQHIIARQWNGVAPMTWATRYNNTWFNAPVHRHEELYNVAFRPSSEVELYTLSNPIRIADLEGNRHLQLVFALRSYKPEEITVTLNKAERAVVIEAAHEAKDGKEHTVSRKYSRKFVLPETLAKVDLSKVELKSYQTAEGYLVVEAELPKMSVEEIAKSPIMSELYNQTAMHGMPTYGRIAAHQSELINNVRPVTVKTA